MLFTFKNCGCCKEEMTDIKVLLNNIFPAGIVDEICNYNLPCSKCKDLNENSIILTTLNNKELTKVEKTHTFL